MPEDNIDYTDDFQYYLEKFIEYQNYIKIAGDFPYSIPDVYEAISLTIDSYKNELFTIYSNLSEGDKLLVAVTCGIPEKVEEEA